MNKSSLINFTFKIVVILLAVIMMTFTMPFKALAQTEQKGKVVRVGWYETPLDKTDEFGRKVGYNYEYQCKIASYADWTYEYVEGSWPELMQMLMAGELDLMSDVSYVEERTEYMLFASSAMGTENYYLFIASDNRNYIHGDYTFFNGKKIGVNKGSVQINYFNEWAKKHDIHAELVEMTGEESETVEKVLSGELDAYLAIDAYGELDSITPIVKVGSSDYYFVVNKNRHDLLDDLEIALGRIQDENPFYNQQLYDKYYKTNGANLFMSGDEQAWLSAHGKLRVGYQDDYLAYCATDKTTSQLTGALKDFLDIAANCIANAHIDFEPIGYATSAAAVEALQKGEVDLIFPVNFGYYEAEQLGIGISQPLMSAELNAIVRNADKATFYQKTEITAAAIENDLNYDSVLMDIFPEWKVRYYPSIQEALRAVSEKKADCFLISNYRYNNIVSMCERYGLTSLETNKNTDYCFAVAGHNKELYSIVGRLINLVPETTISAALTYYYAEDAKVSFGEFIKDNPLIIVVIALVIFALIVVIIAQNRIIVAKKRADQDALTRVKNRHAYLDAEEKMDKLIADKSQQPFAITIFDVNDLKKVNDTEGHHAGDQYICAACKVVCDIFSHSPVYRVGGDEFAVISQGADYEKIDELIEMVAAHNSEAEKNGGVIIACGMAKFDGDESVSLVFERADHKMYENKEKLKGVK